jgi:hypothetical protein
MRHIAESGYAIGLQARFLQHIYLALMLEFGGSRKLPLIANLIGERGEMAKQPLPPIFFGCRFPLLD